MDISMKNFILVLAGTISMILHTCTAKTCPSHHLTNPTYNPDTAGYYDLTDGKCTDRVVYQQRGNSSGYYLYYGYADGLGYYGWIVGLQPCGTQATVFNWNNNKRPDYTLRYWIELHDDGIWYYSFDLRIKCTEGLSFGGLIGVIVACIIAVPILIVMAVILGKYIKNRHKPRRQTSPDHRTNNNRNPGNRLPPPTVSTGSQNQAFTPDQNFQMSPPPFHMMSPPVYENIVSPSGQSRDVNDNFTMPPSYDQVLQEINTSPRAVEIQVQPSNSPDAPESGVVSTPATSEGIYETIGEESDGEEEHSL